MCKVKKLSYVYMKQMTILNFWAFIIYWGVRIKHENSKIYDGKLKV